MQRSWFCVFNCEVKMDNDTYAIINRILESHFGRNGVKLIPDPTGEHEYLLRFNDHIKMTQTNIGLAKSVVAQFQQSRWYDDELRHVDEW